MILVVSTDDPLCSEVAELLSGVPSRRADLRELIQGMPLPANATLVLVHLTAEQPLPLDRLPFEQWTVPWAAVSLDAPLEAAVEAMKLGAADVLPVTTKGRERLARLVARRGADHGDVMEAPWLSDLAKLARQLAAVAESPQGPQLYKAAEALAHRVDQALQRNQRRRSCPYAKMRSDFERLLVRVAVERCDGNKAAAARALGISYPTVLNKLRRPV